MPKACPAQDVLHNKKNKTFITPADTTHGFSSLKTKDGCLVSILNIPNAEKYLFREVPIAGALLIIFSSAGGLWTRLPSLKVAALFHQFPGQGIKPAIRCLFALHENKI